MKPFLTALILGSSVTLLTGCIHFGSKTPTDANVVQVQQQQLQQHAWKLSKINGQSITPNQVVPQLRFDEKTQRVTGTDGCNNIFGHYQIQQNNLHISPLASTRMLCMNDQQLTDQFHLAMKDVVQFQIKDPNTLQLLNQSQQVVVEFHP